MFSIGSDGRSKRQRVDKAAKFEKLKKLKGNKHKYEVQEVENVYEEVDEETYAEKVLERQDDDWIVDDGKYEHQVSLFFTFLHSYFFQYPEHSQNRLLIILTMIGVIFSPYPLSLDLLKIVIRQGIGANSSAKPYNRLMQNKENKI